MWFYWQKTTYHLMLPHTILRASNQYKGPTTPLGQYQTHHHHQPEMTCLEPQCEMDTCWQHNAVHPNCSGCPFPWPFLCVALGLRCWFHVKWIWGYLGLCQQSMLGFNQDLVCAGTHIHVHHMYFYVFPFKMSLCVCESQGFIICIMRMCWQGGLRECACSQNAHMHSHQHTCHMSHGLLTPCHMVSTAPLMHFWWYSRTALDSVLW